ncbi:UBP-type zinc finger domain-containing protein [Herbiconiux solani]|uniref:UBP-type zinc finger domain-containing protein n=1 Tax=Herbiconiux solani TaxID=661329 RepID=UPI000A01300B|nr:UBP-type zinc finger domain-containing protein [Herbiconiux solani]
MTEAPIDTRVPPSGPGCVDCDPATGWWLHLRRCAACGHVGCCDDSPSQHATAHAHHSGHPVVQSYEPGEAWMWDYEASKFIHGPELAEPRHRPVDQPSPGPAGNVPSDWRSQLHRS